VSVDAKDEGRKEKGKRGTPQSSQTKEKDRDDVLKKIRGGRGGPEEPSLIFMGRNTAKNWESKRARAITPT